MKKLIFATVLLFVGTLSAQCDPNAIHISNSREVVSWDLESRTLVIENTRLWSNHQGVCGREYWHSNSNDTYIAIGDDFIDATELSINPPPNVTINVNLPEFTPWINSAAYRVNLGEHPLNSAINPDADRVIKAGPYGTRPIHERCHVFNNQEITYASTRNGIHEDVEPESTRGSIQFNIDTPGDYAFWTYRAYNATNDIAAIDILSYLDYDIGTSCGSPLALFTMPSDLSHQTLTVDAQVNQGLYLIPKIKTDGTTISEVKIDSRRSDLASNRALPERTIDGVVYYYAYVGAYDVVDPLYYWIQVDGNTPIQFQIRKHKYFKIQF